MQGVFMKTFYAYHVVTEHPMELGQKIIFDEKHHSGVFNRVKAKLEAVEDIYNNPQNYNADTLEHHTSVALREIALEEVREKFFPQYPSRLSSLYVSKTLKEAEKWCNYFIELGRPTFQIVKLKIKGNYFIGNANNCFRAELDKKKNLELAKNYWQNQLSKNGSKPVNEMLVDGIIEVVEIIREINTNCD